MSNLIYSLENNLSKKFSIKRLLISLIPAMILVIMFSMLLSLLISNSDHENFELMMSNIATFIFIVAVISILLLLPSILIMSYIKLKKNLGAVGVINNDNDNNNNDSDYQIEFQCFNESLNNNELLIRMLCISNLHLQLDEQHQLDQPHELDEQHQQDNSTAAPSMIGLIDDPPNYDLALSYPKNHLNINYGCESPPSYQQTCGNSND